MIVRIGVVILVLGVLWVLGAIDPGQLPWQNQDFQITGITLLAFIVWSGFESRMRDNLYSNLASVVFTVVLVISAVDSFLLELTVIREPFLIRWIGLGIFVLGAVLRIYSMQKDTLLHHRIGRILLLIGLPTALGSMFGLALASVAGIPAALREEFPLADSEIEEPVE